jgi:hypothetical protein
MEKFITCKCGSPDHIALLSMNKWEKDGKIFDLDVSIGIYLNPEKSFFSRIWIAIKYIFGHQVFSYDEILLDGEKSKTIINFLQESELLRESLD